jgi:NADPH2:quinone reductase
MSAIQIAKAMGARVIATAGSEAKLAFAKQRGADEVLDYSDSGWVDRVKQITAGHGADVIYDPVGGDIFDLSTKCIAPEGRLLIIGFASGRIPSIAVNRIPKLMDWYEAGRIHPTVGATYKLEETPRAMRDLADRKVLGKAVVTF